MKYGLHDNVLRRECRLATKPGRDLPGLRDITIESFGFEYAYDFTKLELMTTCCTICSYRTRDRCALKRLVIPTEYYDNLKLAALLCGVESYSDL